jgi:hypothetical protein
MAHKREKETEDKIAHNERLQKEMARARKDILEANVIFIEDFIEFI